MSHSPTIQLCQDLIQKASTTPEDVGCQIMLAERLERLGFNIEHMPFDDVDNLWARLGTEGPLLVFAGHTDVVPTGPVENWDIAPFEAKIQDGMLYGRGAADMKGSIAAFVTALERFAETQQGQLKGSIALLITSDEEGPAINGTVRVIETLNARTEKIDWCLVGEPSSTETLGDIIKNGRRGSLNADLTIFGKQGHIAYPHLATNPIHIAMPAIVELTNIEWDRGNEFFPATSFQISNLNSGTGVTNVIPGSIEMKFNFRFSTELTSTQLSNQVEDVLKKYGLNYAIKWSLSGNPFLTEPGELTHAAQSAIREVTGTETQLSTSGGTSDGRFIATTGAQVIELGPLNATIHQVNEHVSVQDLDNLSLIYEKMLETLLV